MKGKIITITYGRSKEWSSRKEAMDFFWEGIMQSEGPERDRYVNAYNDLKRGRRICSDGR